MPLSLGDQTHSIPLSLFKENRDRVVAAIRETKKIKNESSAYIILKGGTEDEFGFYDTDTTQTTFRQVKVAKSSKFLLISILTSFDVSGIVFPILVWRF